MTIIRGASPQRNFTILDNPVIEDDQLSFRALGLLAFLLSKPVGWRVNAESLSRGENREGRDAIRTALKELEDQGFLVRQKLRNEFGQWESAAIVYDNRGGNALVSPEPGKPAPGFPKVENQALIQELRTSTDSSESDIVHVDNCSRCDNTGWVLNDDGVAERCDCGYRWQTPKDPLVPLAALPGLTEPQGRFSAEDGSDDPSAGQHTNDADHDEQPRRPRKRRHAS